MKNFIIIFLLLVSFSVLAFGQDFAKGEPKEEYKKMNYYIHWTQEYMDESQYLYAHPEVLLNKYADYHKHTNNLWEALKAFQARLATAARDGGYIPSTVKFTLLLSNVDALGKLQRKVAAKYQELINPRRSEFIWQTSLKYTLASAMMAGIYVKRKWEMDPTRNHEFISLMLMIPFSRKFHFNVGHSQGIAVGASYRLLQSYPLSGGMTEPLEIWLTSQLVVNGHSWRKVMLGPIMQVRVFAGLHFYFGILGQLYLNKKDLPIEDPETYRSIAPILGLNFNPLY